MVKFGSILIWSALISKKEQHIGNEKQSRIAAMSINQSIDLLKAKGPNGHLQTSKLHLGPQTQILWPFYVSLNFRVAPIESAYRAPIEWTIYISIRQMVTRLRCCDTITALRLLPCYAAMERQVSGTRTALNIFWNV